MWTSRYLYYTLSKVICETSFNDCFTKLRDEASRMERAVNAFRSGTKFDNLRKMYEADARKMHTQIRRLHSELAHADIY